jgi:NAD(P)-dependent dehydrogenase (short-subunit alcohol dehydrogenase family)
MARTDYAVANVAEEASVQEAINKTIDKFGRIDIVLNCAGIGSASKTVGKDGAHPFGLL